MQSFTKGVFHSLVTILALWIPTLLLQSHIADMTIGSVASILLNWLISHSIPTTTGVSSRQNSDV